MKFKYTTTSENESLVLGRWQILTYTLKIIDFHRIEERDSLLA